MEFYVEQKTRIDRITKELIGMPRAKNKPNYMREKLMDYCDQILEKLLEEQESLNETLFALMKVDEPYRTVLTCIYIKGKKMEDIAKNDVHDAYDNVCRMHGIGLNLFDEIVKSSEKNKTHQ